MLTNIDEIKTVIILSGNKRLPDLEEEIFANKELTALYLQTLVLANSAIDKSRYNIAWLAYYYARTVMKTRWYAAENTIEVDKNVWRDYSFRFKF